MTKNSQEPKGCKQSTDMLVDLSDTFLNIYDCDVQNCRNINPKDRKDSEKQGMTDDPDVSLSTLKLISENENDPKLALL